MKLPACFIKVSVQEALAPEVGQQIDDAVSGGVTGVWLVDDENAGVSRRKVFLITFLGQEVKWRENPM